MSDAANPSIESADMVETRLSLEMFQAFRRDLSRQEFLRRVMPEMLRAIECERGGLVSQRADAWFDEVWVGAQEEPLPEDLISESMDTGRVTATDRWAVAPLRISQVGRDGSLPQPVASAVVFQLTDAAVTMIESALGAERLARVTEMLAGVLQRLDTRAHQARRIEQLSAVLNAAAEWQRLDDDDALLHRIADTATELLHCERASIFLWDRRRKKLIGRPALGIEGNQLEVDDDAGVVGEVLRTAEPKIWNGNTDDERRVNRKVDQSLDFQTRSLVAVPMGGRRDELIGVFEAINHRDDGFDVFDAAILADLAAHAAVAIESQRKRRTLTESRDRLVDDAASATQLIGQHPAVESVRVSAAKVAATDLTVLVLGNNGTGKEVLARHVHYESQRRNGPFIAVNCAALVETLLESELFGHEKGAFTDANQTRVGKFELASGGTLFLDEVGDMSPGGQAKLLRVLEEKVVVRVGGSQTIPVDVRVIAATNQPLEELIAEKKFREDLFFRLNVVSLTLPPLKARGQDVLLLADHFLHHFCYQIGRQVPALTEDAQQALLAHAWPGNIRELRNTIERVCYLCLEDSVGAADLTLSGSAASRVAATATAADFPPLLNDATRIFQVNHIDAAIEACQGNMTDAAARLG
ncbi:MAG: sigma-54-dependent Fis family transcriptional regulator, partial [Pirellulales bacterium]|nr:sigma-54-dependent Fis family transcriptional regulator [Pirellulales bacterium]